MSQLLAIVPRFRDVRAGPMHPPPGDTALELVGQATIHSINRLATG